VTSIISRVPFVMDYLVTLFTGAATLGQATPPVAVYDGPVVTGDAPGLILWIGMDDPDSDTAPVSAHSDRQWAGLGGQSETITVNCVAESWSGNDSVSAARQSVYGIVAAVEALVRADATQFGGNGLTADPGVTGSDLRQNDTQQGGQARVVFSIILRAL
jgi:hypothetical protein